MLLFMAIINSPKFLLDIEKKIHPHKLPKMFQENCIKWTNYCSTKSTEPPKQLSSIFGKDMLNSIFPIVKRILQNSNSLPKFNSKQWELDVKMIYEKNFHIKFLNDLQKEISVPTSIIYSPQFNEKIKVYKNQLAQQQLLQQQQIHNQNTALPVLISPNSHLSVNDPLLINSNIPLINNNNSISLNSPLQNGHNNPLNIPSNLINKSNHLLHSQYPPNNINSNLNNKPHNIFLPHSQNLHLQNPSNTSLHSSFNNLISFANNHTPNNLNHPINSPIPLSNIPIVHKHAPTLLSSTDVPSSLHPSPLLVSTNTAPVLQKNSNLKRKKNSFTSKNLFLFFIIYFIFYILFFILQFYFIFNFIFVYIFIYFLFYFSFILFFIFVMFLLFSKCFYFLQRRRRTKDIDSTSGLFKTSTKKKQKNKRRTNRHKIDNNVANSNSKHTNNQRNNVANDKSRKRRKIFEKFSNEIKKTRIT